MGTNVHIINHHMQTPHKTNTTSLPYCHRPALPFKANTSFTEREVLLLFFFISLFFFLWIIRLVGGRIATMIVLEVQEASGSEDHVDECEVVWVLVRSRSRG